ncbi:Protein of unknown function DUF1470 [Actinosynnema pretiosum subsp. pretiosum]|nr:Protein of unknown function DUF1470 [Actinosynnema pretiosum subsp. pretiosum]
MGSYDGVVEDRVHVVEAFLNTLDERTFSRHGEAHAPTDELTSEAALAHWLARHGLAPEGVRPSAAHLAAARELRAALRRSLAEPVTTPLAFPLRLVPDGEGGLRVAAEPVAPGVDALLDLVVAAVGDGRWRRVRLCAAPDCRWAFYDTSRNGGGRWCSMAVCGNRTKTKAYRQRRTG